MALRPGDIISMEEYQQRMQANPNQIMLPSDPTKIFHTDDEDCFFGRLIVGTVDTEGTLHIEGILEPAGMLDVDSPASGLNANVNSCWHGTQEKNYSDKSEYQQMLDEFLDKFKQALAARPGVHGNEAQVIMQDCFHQVQLNHKWLACHKADEIAKHAFASSARKILYGGKKAFGDAFNECVFALYFQYIVPAGFASDRKAAIVSANERFQLYKYRLLTGSNGSHGTRRGVIRVLAKHLPCNCVKNIKPFMQPGRKVKICDGCTKLKLSEAVKECSQCKMVSYCCKECQVKDWKAGHKNECKLMRS
jgi:MYND finger